MIMCRIVYILPIIRGETYIYVQLKQCLNEYHLSIANELHERENKVDDLMQMLVDGGREPYYRTFST